MVKAKAKAADPSAAPDGEKTRLVMKDTRRALTINSKLITLVIAVMMVAIPFLARENGFIRLIDNGLISWRFSLAPRPATGNFAYVAIDKKSLDAVGTWPWPRRIHGDLISKLVAAGAQDIFVDIDFSTPSTPAEDALLASALKSVGGGVILPVFRQHNTAEADGEAVVTSPMPELAANAWLAYANVSLDTDGMVRRFDVAGPFEGHTMQAASAVLANAGQSNGTFPIDYSIDPSTVPVFSASDVLAQKLGRAQIGGKSVVIGAYATELKDIFPVPVYGALPGPMLHILAAETISQNRILKDLHQLPFEIVWALLIIATILRLRAGSVTDAVLAALAIIAVGESAAYILQKDQAVFVHTARLWIILAMGLFLLMNAKIDFSGFVAEFANTERRNTRRLLERIVADSADGIIVFDQNVHIVEQNASAAAIIGSHATDKRPLTQVLPEDLARKLEALISRYTDGPGMIHTDTASVPVPVPADGGFRYLDATITISPAERHLESGLTDDRTFVGCITLRDATARHIYQNKIQRLSQIDHLTGLLNRREFTERLDRLEGAFTIAVLDLHRFSVLNATLGRDRGDDLLKAVAVRLSKIGGITLVGRLSGDVFCVAQPSRYADAGTCAETLLKSFDQPFDVGAATVHSTARIGICESPFRDGDANTWIERAECALDDAKSVAGSGWRTYNPASALRQVRARQLEGEMRQAIDLGEFFLLYQPQVDLRSGTLMGAEALIRWKHREFGVVSPAEFIPVSEANGLICEIGRWVLQTACRQAAEWPVDLSVSVNVSPVQFENSDVVSDVKCALQASGIHASRLHIEITESAFISGDKLLTIVQELRTLGATVALDDFGTGYSSLSFMTGFPLDILKIDQSFVRKLSSEPQSLALITAIKSLAQGLALKTVAEGIETEAEWEILAAIGCEIGQGYYFGRPQSGSHIPGLLDTPTWKADRHARRRVSAPALLPD